MQRRGEQGEDWRPGDPLQPLNVPGGVHVEGPQPDEHHAQHCSRQNHPGTDGEDDCQDTGDVETNLEREEDNMYRDLDHHLTDITSYIAGGRISSMEPISLENLFRIRP